MKAPRRLTVGMTVCGGSRRDKDTFTPLDGHRASRRATCACRTTGVFRICSLNVRAWTIRQFARRQADQGGGQRTAYATIPCLSLRWWLSRNRSLPERRLFGTYIRTASTFQRVLTEERRATDAHGARNPRIVVDGAEEEEVCGSENDEESEEEEELPEEPEDPEEPEEQITP